MKRYGHLLILSGTVLTVLLIFAYLVYQTSLTPDVLQAENQEAIQNLQYWGEWKRANYPRLIWGGVAMLAGILFFLGVSTTYTRVQRSQIFFAKIDKSEIPILKKHLPEMTPILTGLVTAKQMEANALACEKVIPLYADLIELQRRQYQSLPLNQTKALPLPESVTMPTHIPTLTELLQRGELGPGRPNILGYDTQGEPIKRSLRDCKSLAVTGQQGSGKTLTMAYLVSMAVLCDHALAYVIDPHLGHSEGLSTYLRPLIDTGRVQAVNSFETPTLIRQLDHLLDRRLAGIENSDPTIIFVIDELARLARLEVFDGLVAFLERCSEETRKANMIFIGASHKWTARHFKNRADIRACMNSALIHNTKPSMADLLLEDTHDRNMVKDITQPGQAVLMTDFSPTRLIHIPYLTIADVQQIANTLGAVQENTLDVAFTAITSHTEPAALPDNVIAFPVSETLSLQTVRQWSDSFSSKAEAARQIGIDRTYLSKILSGERDLTLDIQRKIAKSLYRGKCDNAQKTA